MSIPTTASVRESAVISAPIDDLWNAIQLSNVHAFWTNLKDNSSEANVTKWTFKDGTVLDVKQEEHSNIDHYITYSVISAQPPLSYSSVVSTIRCYPITSGQHAGHTYVVWTGNFSSDAAADVIEDAKYKRREALADLAKKVGK